MSQTWSGVCCSIIITLTSLLTVKAVQEKLICDTCPFSAREFLAPEARIDLEDSLYQPTDPILQLDISNFDDEVFNKKNNTPKAHLVEFYLGWCGHCRYYAPIYVKFSEDVKRWNTVVEVSAINCDLDLNTEVCFVKNNVKDMPHIKYFGRNAKKYEDALDGEVYLSPGHLRHQLVDFILQDHNLHHYANWPSFQFLPNNKNMTKVWAVLPSTTEHLVLIFERPNVDNYTTMETILDLFPHYPSVVVRQVKNDHPLTKQWDIVDFPSLAILRRGEDTPFFLTDARKMTVGNILGVLELGPPIDYNSTGPFIITPPTTPRPQPTTPETPETRRAKYYDSETDLLKATRYAITAEIASAQEIVGANFTALVRFVSVLKKYFPKSDAVKDALKQLKLPVGEALPRSGRARLFLADLADYLASLNSKNASITSQEWIAKIKELGTRYQSPFPENLKWQHCRGSSYRYRGYTCGLWSLFHTLTVNAYLEDGQKPNFDPLHVLQAIKGYVNVFFKCTECSKHFIEMVTKDLKMEELVKNSSDVVMYLWRAHNVVNNRLAKDRTEDPTFPKYQFPPEFLCQDCEKNKQPKDLQDWNYQDVLHFLIKYYTGIRPYEEVVATTTPHPFGKTTRTSSG